MSCFALLVVAGCVTVEREVPRGPDAAPADAGPDAAVCPGAPLEAPAPLTPWNGAATGSAHAPDARRPVFRWRAVMLPDGTEARYEIEIDDSCEIGKHARCPMPSPVQVPVLDQATFQPETPLEVSELAPVGRRYAWRVRACDPCGACGPASEGRYVDVGRQSADLDGDGYADVVIGAYLEDDAAALRVNQGQVEVFWGGPDAIAPSLLAIDPPIAQAEGRFGHAVAMVGDLDADGFGDLIVGAYALNSPEADEGVAFVVYGAAEGSRAAIGLLDNPRDLASGSFGVSIAGAGDLDGDGWADVLVGAYSQTLDLATEGAVYVYRGGPRGIAAWPSAELRSPAPQTNGVFGRRIAGAGDVDGDGRSDVVVGAQNEDGEAADQGRAFFYSGWNAVSANVPTVTFENPTPQEAAGFGNGVAGAGDVDSDGFGDVLVGAATADDALGGADSGTVYLYRGGEAGPSATPSVTLANPQTTGPGIFGFAMVALGDVDLDGFGDVLVGAPWSSPGGVAGAGEAFFYPGSAAGLDPSAFVPLPRPNAQTGLSFGEDVGGPRDVDGDGDSEILVGVPGLDDVAVDEGAALLFRGTPVGPSAEWEVLPNATHQLSSRYASAVASPSP